MTDATPIPLSSSGPKPHCERAEGASRSLGEPNPNSAVRNLFRPDHFRSAAEGCVKRMSGCEQQPSPNARETRLPDQSHEGACFFSAQRLRGAGQGGRSRDVSGSSPPGRVSKSPTIRSNSHGPRGGSFRVRPDSWAFCRVEAEPDRYGPSCIDQSATFSPPSFRLPPSAPPLPTW
jgi:hypothetical protein